MTTRAMTTSPGPPPDATAVRRTAQALLACALGVFPLGQVLSDRGWLIDVWLTMLVVIGPALVLRRTRAPGALQVWPGIALLVPWLTLRFLPHHAFAGVIPTLGTWRDIAPLMDDLHHTTHNETAPVHSTVAVRLALCVLLGLLTALVDLIAVVGRHGALGVVPLLVVYTISGAIARRSVAWPLFALAAVGFLLLLAIDSRDDVEGWGYHVAHQRAARQRRRSLFAGQRIAVAAIAVAVVLPMLLPARSTDVLANLIRGASGGGGGTAGFGADGTGSIDPFAALRGQLQRAQRLPLLAVTVSPVSAPPPFYLRENVLDQYVGSGWQSSGHGPSTRVEASALKADPPTPYGVPSVTFSAEIQVTGLTGNAPIFAQPIALNHLASGTQWSARDQLLLGHDVREGETFQETVSQAAPSVADLESATTGRTQDMSRWLQLPQVPAAVHTLVTSLIAGKATPYAKARALSDYFSDPANGFTYSLQTRSGTSGSDLVDFLTNKTGYCQQYAAAMGVMLRLAQVPARVVLGYTHPVPDAAGRFTVTTDDAHAWVEAYFDGVGWIPFDTTPLAGITGGAANDLSWAPHNKPIEQQQPPVTTSTPTPSAPEKPTPTGAAAPVAAAAGDGGQGAGWGQTLALVLGWACLAVLLVLTPAVVRGRRTRHRIRAGRRGYPDALWAELSDTAIDLGYVWSPARTPRQVVGWLGAGPALESLALAVERARYAPAAAAVDADELTRDLAIVAARLRAGRGLGDRVRARLWPASLGWAARARALMNRGSRAGEDGELP
jgi:transglutaminase-like putative cysteine protease